MKRGSVLIVEDNRTQQMLIKEAFEQIEIEGSIHTVSDGDEAIAFLKRKGKYADCETYPFPTFLLTDLSMPRVNGFELLLFIKRSQFTIVPTIVYTMSTEPDHVKTAYRLGANAYHVKPPRMKGLVEQLRKIYEYWTTMELPVTDGHGRLGPSDETLTETLRHPVLFTECE